MDMLIHFPEYHPYSDRYKVILLSIFTFHNTSLEDFVFAGKPNSFGRCGRKKLQDFGNVRRFSSRDNRISYGEEDGPSKEKRRFADCFLELS